MKRFLIYAVTAAVALLLAAAPAVYAAGPYVAGEAALLVDLSTGQCLYEKNADRKMYPASTTKMLTALLALKHGDPNDLVTVGAAAEGVEGSSIYLKEGERITLDDLLWALLLNSSNDAAVAVAEHIGGSVDAFVKMMNDEARRLGASGAHFVNPHGLHDEQHYATARDLAHIAVAALRDPRFRKYVGETMREIPREDPEAQQCLVNTNKLLWRYEGASGIKTGYTSQAHQCLVALAERGGRELLAVVLKNEDGNVWADCTALLDYGFEEFVSVEAVAAGVAVSRIPVVAGDRELDVVTGRSLRWVFPARGAAPVVHWETVLEKEIKAPIQEGESVGSMVIKCNGADLGRVPLLAGNDVAGADPAMTGKPWYFWVGIVFGGMISAACGIRYVRRMRNGFR